MDQDEGNSNLPSALNMSKFSAARGKEIQILHQALSSSTGIKLAFQKLPKHMRRRAMSHNVKRLPRRLREIHMSQMTKSGLPPKQKRPSRKYRRRPYNLTSDYMKRQRKSTWLNTHIWHAKRFHMVNKWGYKLPNSPCDRAFKACYRATAMHCLLQDISYYNCLELTGDYNKIISGFKEISDSSIDLNLSAKSIITGLREGKLILLKPCVKKVIGTIKFLWKPFTKGDKRTLWLWLHAAFYDEALKAIIDNFCLSDSNIENNMLVYSNNTFTLRVLKNVLSRFALTGPLSNTIIWNALKLIDTNQIDNENNNWIKSFLEDKDENYLFKMRDYWKSLQFVSSPAEFSPHIILPLIIQDPRFHFPKKRTKAYPVYSESSVNTLWNLLENPIFEENFRNVTVRNKLSQASLAKLHEKLLVPGSAPEEVPTSLPITLIQRPGKRSKEHNGNEN